MPVIFHAHTCGMVRSVEAARRRGALVIADHRDVHPREHDYVDPLIDEIEYEFRMADWIIVNSRFAAETLFVRGISERKVVVIPLGVDLSMFSPVRVVNRPTPTRQIVLFVGSLSRRKGVDILLEAFSGAEFKDVELRVCGPGSSSALVRGPRGATVNFLGALSRVSLVKEYQNASLTVMPSRTDAFGLVAAESLACGTPVIVTERCGIADLVREHGGGVVIRPGDADELATAVKLTLRDPARLGELAGQSFGAAKASSWKQYSVALRRFYTDLVIPGFSHR
jgi:glycosyltransferase involved in cell wall biosynthesis